MKSYAGIGSRETPPYILQEFVRLGTFLARHGYTLRSGHADGADKAFEIGCDLVNGKKEIWIPWRGFNDSDSTLIVSNPVAFKTAAKFHPRWTSLSEAAQKLHARNTHQIFGRFLNDPCDFVVCWTFNGLGKGGTGQALRIAENKEIPIFDFGKYTDIARAKREFNLFYEGVKKK